MPPVDGKEHSCPSVGAEQDEPQSTEVQRPKRPSRPGVAAIEYCLLLSIITVFLVIAAQNLGVGTKGIFLRMATIFASDAANTDGDDQKAVHDDDDDDDNDDDRGRERRGRGWGRGGRR